MFRKQTLFGLQRTTECGWEDGRLHGEDVEFLYHYDQEERSDYIEDYYNALGYDNVVCQKEQSKLHISVSGKANRNMLIHKDSRS